MKTLLIYPNWHDPMYSTLPIGLASIAAVLMKNGIEVAVMDCSAENMGIEDIVRRVGEFKPDVIGVSAMTPMIGQALEIARAVKNVSKAFVVIGGVHASICPDDVISNEHVDFAVMGEGECTFLELCRAIGSGDVAYEKIDGLVFRRDGRIVRNKPRELVNLDDYPIAAVELFPVRKYRQSIGDSNFMTMITSRGCPYVCTYCINSCDAVFGKKYRAVSPERVIQELKHYIKTYQFTEIDFYDDNFTFNKARVHAICDLILKEGLRFKWKCSSRAESIDEELVRKMKQAGCWLIAFGVESGDRKILDAVRRNTSIDKVKNAFRLTHQAGIKTVGYFMIGFPDDTWETVGKTIQLARDINPTYAQFAIVTPYPGTRIYDEYKKDNLIVSNDWSKFNYTGTQVEPVVRSRHMTADELALAYKKALRSFYFRPGYMWRQLLDNLSIEGFQRLFRGFMLIVRSSGK